MRRIFVVGSSVGYANWMNGELVKDMEDADLVVFTGGEDINPALYGETEGKFTWYNPNRDMREVEEWNKAQKLNKPIIGICRGAQLACAMSGGSLVQHQENPHSPHAIRTDDGREIMITSLHHQAQYPYTLKPKDYKVLATSYPRQSKIHWDGKDKEISDKEFDEVEICYYPKTRSLGIQGHPEMMWYHAAKHADTFEYLHGLLDKLIEDKI